MIAAIYARKSTDQNGIGDEHKSVTRQVEHAKVYARDKGWTVSRDHIYIDDGISGAEFAKRPGFLRLMNTLKSTPPFQVLIMSEESRLGRESISTQYALKQLVQAGVRIFFYLEDRERTLDGPMDKIMLSLTTGFDELERERARQRTTDAMRRKALAGHVTGGRVFGYDNMRMPEGHVEHRINKDEAAVVRHIFELCVMGHGKTAIAKTLNAEGALTPRAQQGRPHAWAPSSVRAVLYRELYKGEVVWNKTKKRDGWGRVKQEARPEDEWIRVSVPKLRIMSDKVWDDAHARLANARETYLRATKGKFFGRPLNGTHSKHLLIGLARCGHCGGSLEIRTRSHGHHGERKSYYACSSYYRRGRSVCPNRLEVPLDATNAAVIATLGRELLTPAFVDAVVRKVLTRTAPKGQELEETRTKLTAELGAVNVELVNLTDALATSRTSKAITAALKKREARQAYLEGELAGLERRQEVSELELTKLEGIAREKVGEWRTLLRRHVPQARQILKAMLREKLVFLPELRNGDLGYRFSGEGSLTKLLTGLVPEFSQAVASPRGIVTGWNRVFLGFSKAA